MAKQKKPRRLNFRFSDVGIRRGETIFSKYDASLKSVVVRAEDNVVKFEGKEMPLKDATTLVLKRKRKDWKKKWWLQPIQHWKYQGELLREIYERKFPVAKAPVPGRKASKAPSMGPEGAEQTNLATRYERNQSNREKAIKEHGVKCFGCGITMEKMYGKIAKDFIHIHHVKPISTVPEGSQPDPDDLLPLCPNCHAVVHLGESPRRSPKQRPLTIKELRALIRKNNTS